MKFNALITSLAVAMSVSLSLAGSFEDGVAAHKRGDYGAALKFFKAVAEQGDATAQYNLGLMYSDGQGVPQDYAEAMRWYKLAAQQGDSTAQHNLGVMYAKGQGVLQDYARSYLWFNLAATKGDSDSVKNRDISAKNMTPQEIAEAQKMARECLASNYKKCD